MDSADFSRLGTLRQLQIFAKVAEHQSMARAAEELFLSQSAISIQIRKLSEAAGLPLHEVIGKQLYLTCLLYTSPSPRDATLSRMPSSA